MSSNRAQRHVAHRCSTASRRDSPGHPASPTGPVTLRRRTALARRDFSWLVAIIRSGPPRGFFRISWVRRFANLNEFFVHHEDVRRANGRGPRTNSAAMDAALWRNVMPNVFTTHPTHGASYDRRPCVHLTTRILHLGVASREDDVGGHVGSARRPRFAGCGPRGRPCMVAGCPRWLERAG